MTVMSKSPWIDPHCHREAACQPRRTRGMLDAYCQPPGMEDVAALSSRVFRKCGILAMTIGMNLHERDRTFHGKVLRIIAYTHARVFAFTF